MNSSSHFGFKTFFLSFNKINKILIKRDGIFVIQFMILVFRILKETKNKPNNSIIHANESKKLSREHI